MNRLMPILLLAAFICAAPLPAHASPGLEQSLADIGNGKATPSSFYVCHGRDCRIRTQVSLTKTEWARVRRLFPAKSAQHERSQIARAIGYLERVTGKKAGTGHDKGGTFEDAFTKGQMDCEDETMNTGNYLSMMERQKLLRYHSVAGRAHRGYFLNGWPHRAVRIAEKKTGNMYVVDSWFHDNGVSPEIVTYKLWKDGWRPAAAQKTVAHK